MFTGDVMYDAVLFNAQRAQTHSGILGELRLKPGEFSVATVHRAENTAPEELRTLLQAINDAATRLGRIVLPMHPRTAAVLRSEVADWRAAANLLVTNPLGYFDMLALLQSANSVLTDSGGLQKEAYFLGCPCVTLRNETEWLETLKGGANRIAGSDGGRLTEMLSEQQRMRRSFGEPPQAKDGPFGAGNAAQRIVEAIVDLCELPQ